MSITRPDGTRIDVGTRGTGSPVVLIHGYTANRDVWRCVESELNDDDCQVHAIDLRGHGASSRLTAPTTVHDMAADVAAVIEEAALVGTVLVGHSLGGMVVQLLAASRPDLIGTRVAGLLLVNTSGNPMGHRATRVVGRMFQSRLVDVVSATPGLRTKMARVAFPTQVPAERIRVQAGLRPPARGSRLHFDVEGVPDLLPGNERVGVPVTVLASTKDIAIPVAATAALAESIPHSRLRLLPGTGHLLPLERPDVVAHEIRLLNKGR
jgi:pimeloyl-ACP methyl ester carboxylesterase